MSSVVVTGALGNIGRKLVRHFRGVDGVAKVIGLDLREPPQDHRAEFEASMESEIEFIACDLTDWRDRRWRDAVEGCDAIVHLAAQNPFPEASWDDANRSLEMTMNVGLAAADAGVRRVVFVSSNHVMGRYKDSPLAETIGPGGLTTSLEHAVGTEWDVAERHMDSTAYAVAKSSGERFFHVLGERAGGRTTFVCIRVGWCQPGENVPATLSAAGTPTQAMGLIDDPEFQRADRWFREMWLSNRDVAQLFERAVFADSDFWPGGCVVVNGNSGNTGMAWSLDEARKYLGYEPQDDVYA